MSNPFTPTPRWQRHRDPPRTLPSVLARTAASVSFFRKPTGDRASGEPDPGTLPAGPLYHSSDLESHALLHLSNASAMRRMRGDHKDGVKRLRRPLNLALRRLLAEILLKFVFFVFEIFGIRRGLTLAGNVRPLGRKGTIQLQPLLHALLRIGHDRAGRAFGLTDAAVDALVWIDDQHVFALVEAIHGADFDTVHVLALDASLGHDIGHQTLLKRPRVNATPGLAQGSPGRHCRFRRIGSGPLRTVRGAGPGPRLSPRGPWGPARKSAPCQAPPRRAACRSPSRRSGSAISRCSGWRANGS